MYTDSKLLGAKKCQLINVIRCLELNIEDLEEVIHNQSRLLLDYDTRFRWHDLRKNPDDLPEEYSTVLVAWKPYGAYEVVTYTYNGNWADDGGEITSSIPYGWMYIPKFEEEK